MMRFLRFGILAVMVVCLCLVAFSAYAADAEYVGLKKCKGCHSSEYKSWTKDKHSNASEPLNDEQKKDANCMKCHGTGAEKGAVMENVECEACHGPGSLYKSPKIMSKSKYKKDAEKQRAMAVEAGLILVDENNCLGCHGADRPEGHIPAKEFNFSEMVEQVKHK